MRVLQKLTTILEFLKMQKCHFLLFLYSKFNNILQVGTSLFNTIIYVTVFRESTPVSRTSFVQGAVLIASLSTSVN